MPFKRAHYRANFDSSLSVTDINDFVDGVYRLCDREGLKGLIIEIDDGGQFIVEGDDSKVDDIIGYLDAAAELENQDNYLNETDGPFFTCLASHVSGDARGSNC